MPKEYSQNIANCMIAMRIARQIGADPLMVMQNLDIVHGRPSWRAQFLIGTVNSCGRFSAIRYEFFGDRDKDSWGCRAWAVEKSTNEKLVGPDISIALAKAEGWYQKSGSKWKTMPQLMLMYRAGAWWTRAYAPELSLGMQTSDEMADSIVDVTARVVEPEREAMRNAAAALAAKPFIPPVTEVVDPETGEVTETTASAEATGETPATQEETKPEELAHSEAWPKACSYLETMTGEFLSAKTAKEQAVVTKTLTETVEAEVKRKAITEAEGSELLATWAERTKKK